MISIVKTIYLIIILLLVILSAPTIVVAGATTLYQSVEQALSTNPQLQTLAHNSQALQHDLDQSRGAYLPTVDLSLGGCKAVHNAGVT